MKLEVDVLSLWEVSHRWFDKDPDVRDPQQQTLEVKDLARNLALAAIRSELRLCSPSGVEFQNQSDIKSLEDIVASHESQEDYSEDEHGKYTQDDYEEYLDFMDRKTQKHCAACEKLNDVVRKRLIEPNILDTVWVTRESIRQYCFYMQVSLPKFWFEEEKTKDRLTKDKEEVRLAAKEYWSNHPNATVAEVIKSKEVQIEGSGKLYKPDTIRKWIKDLDPRPSDQRVGRPKKQ
ncbi:MAG: hypothetical protein MK096_06385 [Oleiphilaceae bacterium]|nr:hypothetical protein [Oleiphilaceae bacterium]